MCLGLGLCMSWSVCLGGYPKQSLDWCVCVWEGVCVWWFTLSGPGGMGLAGPDAGCFVPVRPVCYSCDRGSVMDS